MCEGTWIPVAGKCPRHKTRWLSVVAGVCILWLHRGRASPHSRFLFNLPASELDDSHKPSSRSCFRGLVPYNLGLGARHTTFDSQRRRSSELGTCISLAAIFGAGFWGACALDRIEVVW